MGEVVAVYVDDQYLEIPTEKDVPVPSPQGEAQALVTPDHPQKRSGGPYVKAEDLHSIGRMNGLSKYVHTRDAFFDMKRMNYEEWRRSANDRPAPSPQAPM